MYIAFFVDGTPVPPLLATVPSLFAKSSLVWPALLNILVNKNYVKFFKDKKKRDLTISGKSPGLIQTSDT
jgi:hypothetical protein